MSKETKYIKTDIGFPDRWNPAWNKEVNEFQDVVLRVETTNVCNFKCDFCEHSNMQRVKGFMRDELYRKIIDEAYGMGFKNLDIRNMGEPLLDIKICEKVKYANKKGFENIYIHTNGYLLNEQVLDALGSAGMTMIIISLSPRNEFEKTRPGIKFKAVEKMVSEIRKSSFRNIVKIDYIKTGISKPDEEAEFKKWLEDSGLQLRENIKLHNWAKGTGETQRLYLCHRLWTSVTILWDGQVCLCCLDYEGEINLGNVSREQLATIVNGPDYCQIRGNHLGGYYLPKCSVCDMVKMKDI